MRRTYVKKDVQLIQNVSKFCDIIGSCRWWRHNRSNVQRVERSRPIKKLSHPQIIEFQEPSPKGFPEIVSKSKFSSIRTDILYTQKVLSILYTRYNKMDKTSWTAVSIY